jgi:hypothetical protein
MVDSPSLTVQLVLPVTIANRKIVVQIIQSHSVCRCLLSLDEHYALECNEVLLPSTASGGNHGCGISYARINPAPDDPHTARFAGAARCWA